VRIAWQPLDNLLLETESDQERAICLFLKDPIVKPASISEAVPLVIKTDPGHDHQIDLAQSDFFAAHRLQNAQRPGAQLTKRCHRKKLKVLIPHTWIDHPLRSPTGPGEQFVGKHFVANRAIQGYALCRSKLRRLKDSLLRAQAQLPTFLEGKRLTVSK